MMKQLVTLVILISLISCEKNSLKAAFDCKSNAATSALKEYRDVLKKFRVKVPKNWKTELYYDDFQSEIFTADTTKGLTETYIFDVSWHQGELNLAETFDQNVKDTLAIKERLSNLKSGFGKFKNNDSYYNLSKGKSSGYDYHFLQVYVKTEVDEYITMSTKIYGDQHIDQRICESIALFDTIEIIN